ncbi:hypothetical protein Q0590_36305 [Rhodocytophaga aerolata]|uniref:Uncharacterized protein n=1 Tax=Rhodocytophaga aerolata TaxID=455078 RepID=A0ABT8RJX4_9BACT|nr:hypothetical protein [Rhodocytophaga aerolata]MDO1451794.1 hypothetical protein [Rhodocytophaga aerolata]
MASPASISAANAYFKQLGLVYTEKESVHAPQILKKASKFQGYQLLKKYAVAIARIALFLSKSFIDDLPAKDRSPAMQTK